MSGRIEKIVVAGDVTIDWLQWRVEEQDPEDEQGRKRPNWELYKGTAMTPLRGGALLLADLVAAATGLPVLAPELGDLHNIPPNEVLHSNVLVANFPHTLKESQRKPDKAKYVFRVKEYLGYYGPGDGLNRLKVLDDDPDADLVILDDAGNRFRHQEKLPQAITTDGKTPLVILKMSRPLQTGPLWKLLAAKHADRLVLVIDADDLRAEDINISRQLSWERTFLDFVRHLLHHHKLSGLKECSHLIVRFGLDGAIRYRKGEGGGRVWFYYDPLRLEGGFQEQIGQGKMMGLASAFVAALTRQVVQHSREKNKRAEEALEEVVGLGVREGIRSARRLMMEGFGKGAAPQGYPVEDIFAAEKENPEITELNLHLPSIDPAQVKDLEDWSILKKTSQDQEEYVACKYLEEGASLDLMPTGQFGKLKTVDRKEIESLQAIKNLLREYLSRDRVQRPLSLAVFGPPGAGKSFTVTQVAESVAPDDLKPLEFNLSQWETPDDLTFALHQVRDVTLRGKFPLVFFDEFDCRYRNESLGWLKYFLGPMQDGAFRQGGITFHLGKAIFVFAGGTSFTLEEFSREIFPNENGLKEEQKEEKRGEFKSAKGPDFVSRLRGYVNIPGINPDSDHPNDRSYLIRRALLLRNLIMNQAPDFFDRHKKRLRIDWGVLQALLKVPRYKHGVRSLQAVLDMSRLSGRPRPPKFEAAALPPREQLKLHVAEQKFCELVIGDVPYDIQVEQVARAIHKRFILDNPKKDPDDPSMQAWEALAEHYKESNRGQARHTEVKLKAIGYAYKPVEQGKSPGSGSPPAKIEFDNGELMTIAKLEHERWLLEKRNAGYVYGPVKYDPKKIHNCLLDWDELTEEEQVKDFKTMRAIPELLASVGLEVYREDKPEGDPDVEAVV